MDAVRKHDHEMCKNWVKNLDALLVFVRTSCDFFYRSGLQLHLSHSLVSSQLL